MKVANNFAACLICYYCLKSRHFLCQGPYTGDQPRLCIRGLRLTKPTKNMELGVTDICYLHIYDFHKKVSVASTM